MRFLSVVLLVILTVLPVATLAQEVSVPVNPSSASALAGQALNGKKQPDKSQSRGPTSGEAYAAPTSKDLLQTLVMLKGEDFTDTVKVDDYARLMYCKLYKEKFSSDFEWNTIRAQIIDRIKLKKEYYRRLYEISGVIYLGRYNFETQDFPLVKQSSLFNVSSLIMLQDTLISNGCSADYKNSFPTQYVAKLKQPLTVDRLKVPLDDAEKLLDKMDKSKNMDRRMYIRFRVRLNSLIVDPRLSAKGAMEGNFTADLVGIDVFYDKDMRQLFTSVSLD